MPEIILIRNRGQNFDRYIRSHMLFKGLKSQIFMRILTSARFDAVSNMMKSRRVSMYLRGCQFVKICQCPSFAAYLQWQRQAEVRSTYFSIYCWKPLIEELLSRLRLFPDKFHVTVNTNLNQKRGYLSEQK